MALMVKQLRASLASPRENMESQLIAEAE